MAASEQELLKIIQTKQTFADLAYKEYRASKYGMTFCCPSNFNDHTIVNEICDWENKKIDTLFGSETYTMSTWDWSNWITQGGTQPPNFVRRVTNVNAPTWQKGHGWVQRNTPFGSNFVGAGWYDSLFIARSGAEANDMTITVTASQLDGSTAWNDPDKPTVIRNKSRIYVVCNLHDQGGINLSTDPLSEINRSHDRQQLTRPTGSTATLKWLLMFDDWILLNPDTNLVPASGDFVTKIRENTNSTFGTGGGYKNGANKSDTIFIIIDTMGDGLKSSNLAANDPDTRIGILFWNTTSGSFINNGMGAQTFSQGSSQTIDSSGTNKPTGSSQFFIYEPSSGNARASTQFWNTDYYGNYVEGISPYWPYREAWNCKEDAEGIIVEVKDSLGNFVKDYPVIIDNKYVGKTDSAGMFYHTILDASNDTKHMINCKCFTTTGGCDQQLIQIVTTTNPLKPTCTNKAIDCL